MNKTAKNSIIYLSGTIVMGLLGFVNTMLLTRILSQQVYAMYGLLTTFVTAADMFVAFGYDQSYMRFYYSHDRSPKGFLWECLKVPLGLFALFALVLLEPGQHLVRYVFEDKLSLIAVLALVAQILFSSAHRFTQLTARMGEFAGNYVFSNILSKSGFIGLLLVVWLIHKSVAFEWVVVSFAIMAALSTAVNLVVFRKIGARRNPEGKSVTNKELFRYGFPYMLNNVIVLLIPVLEKIIIRDLAGWEVLSIFTAASVFQTVVSMVNLTLSNIWNPIVYKNCENESAFKPILHMFGMVGTMILVLGTAACILLRRWLVLLLDEKYFTVYIIAPVILLAACLNILSTIYSVGINIKKKTIHFVIAPVLQIVTSVTLCYLLIPAMGLTGVGIAVLCSLGISHGYRIFVGLKLYNTGVAETKTVLLCAAAIAAAVCSLFFVSLQADILISILLIVCACFVVNKEIMPIAKSVKALLKTNKQK